MHEPAVFAIAIATVVVLVAGKLEHWLVQCLRQYSAYMEPDHQIHSVKGETDDRRHQASNRQTQSESTGVLPMIAECIVCERVQYRVLENPTGPQYERCTFRSSKIFGANFNH